MTFQFNTGKYHTIIYLLLVVLLLAGAYLGLNHYGTIDFLKDATALKEWIRDLGVFGPVMIIALITVAIVMSPIPSAPVALASGALYGHTEGTLYVVLGAELGAVSAFFIARLSGVNIFQNRFGRRFSNTLVGSQNTLMGIVFVSRLLPFVSFDFISYAAGVTPLTFWRFALATLAGIIPASFLLAHFGSELTSANSDRIALAVLGLGLFALVPIIYGYFSRNK